VCYFAWWTRVLRGHHATLVFIEKVGALEQLFLEAPKSFIWYCVWGSDKQVEFFYHSDNSCSVFCPMPSFKTLWGSGCGLLMPGRYSDVNQLSGTVSASQLEDWEIDPQPMSESTQCSLGKSVHLCCYGRKQTLGFGLPQIAVTKIISLSPRLASEFFQINPLP